MSLFLFRFWPVLLPLLIYGLWYLRMRRRAQAKDETPPHFRDGPWYWAVLASLIAGLGCFLWLWVSTQGEKGAYVPPRLQDGRIVPGHIEK